MPRTLHRKKRPFYGNQYVKVVRPQSPQPISSKSPKRGSTKSPRRPSIKRSSNRESEILRTVKRAEVGPVEVVTFESGQRGQPEIFVANDENFGEWETTTTEQLEDGEKVEGGYVFSSPFNAYYHNYPIGKMNP